MKISNEFIDVKLKKGDKKMEKIGLFDILDKFGRTTNGKTDFASGKKTPADENGRAADRDFTLRDPEDCAPPQYMMNAKMLAFIRRHEELVAAVPPKTPTKRGRKKNSVSQTSRSKAKKRKKKSAQTKGITQENRTKKPDVKEASGEEPNVSNAVAEEKTKQMAESRIETEKKASQPEAHVAENFQDHAPKTEAVLLENITAEPQTGKSSAEKQEENIKSASKSGLFTHILEILSKIIRFPGNLWNKVISIIKGIIEKIKNIKKTISGITDKLGWWKEFLTNERTKAAISLIWKDAKGLLHHVLPTKLEGDVTFGCDDPAITGTVLAVLGMTFPFHKNRIHVNPLFDGENQLTGNVFLKGRIYGIVLIKAAIEIYFNKNIKYVINRWKHKED